MLKQRSTTLELLRDIRRYASYKRFGMRADGPHQNRHDESTISGGQEADHETAEKRLQEHTDFLSVLSMVERLLSVLLLFPFRLEPSPLAELDRQSPSLLFHPFAGACQSLA